MISLFLLKDKFDLVVMRKHQICIFFKLLFLALPLIFLTFYYFLSIFSETSSPLGNKSLNI